MSKMTRVIAVSFLVVLLTSGQALADFLDFNMDGFHSQGVSISYAGGLAPLTGADISVDKIDGMGTPLNSGGTLALTDAILSFVTGASTGAWTWGQGGTIQIIGDIASLNLTDAVLLAGTFTSAQVSSLGSTFVIALTGFTDDKNEAIETYFGYDSSTQWSGNFNLSFSIPAGTLVGDAFESSAVYSGDVVNNPVPVPAAVWLLCSGLLGLIGMRKRFVR